MDDLPSLRGTLPRAESPSARRSRCCAPSCCCLSRATADARPGDPGFGPREALIAGGPWAELSRLADSYRAGRGHRVPCPATLWIYSDSDPNTAATGQMPGCNIGFNRTWLLAVRSTQRIADHYGRHARMGKAHPIVGRAAIQQELLAQMCLNVVHERGHNLGLDHRHRPAQRDVSARGPSAQRVPRLGSEQLAALHTAQLVAAPGAALARARRRRQAPICGAEPTQGAWSLFGDGSRPSDGLRWSASCPPGPTAGAVARPTCARAAR